jgi:hypothetical protein
LVASKEALNKVSFYKTTSKVSFEKVEATWTKAKIGLLLPIFDNSAKAALTAVFWSSGLIDLTLLMIKSKAAKTSSNLFYLNL